MASSLFGPGPAPTPSSTFTSFFPPDIVDNFTITDFDNAGFDESNPCFQLPTDEFLALATNDTHDESNLEQPYINQPSSSAPQAPTWSFGLENDQEDTPRKEVVGGAETLADTNSPASSLHQPTHTSDASFHEPAQSSATSFHDSPGSNPDSLFEGIPTTKWDLRPRDLQNNTGHTWIDRDDSGDYNPATENRKPPPAPLRRKRSIGDVREDQRGEEGEEGQKKTKLTSWLSARQNGHSFPVALKLNSAKAKQLLASYTDNWPEHPGDSITDDADASDDNVSSNNNNNNNDLSTPYNLRNRTENPDDPSLAPENQIGHPSARGCKSCVLTGQTCPLIASPSATYPCDMCAEDDFECELLVQPKRKQNCEHCKKRRKKCSYGEEGGDHTGPCEQCSEEGFHCVAGAAFDPDRVRMDAEGKPAMTMPAPRRPRSTRAKNDGARKPRYTTCTNCKAADKRCSLRKTAMELPCRRCDDNSLTCSLDDTDVNTDLTTTTPGIDPRIRILHTHALHLRQKLLADFPAPVHATLPPTQHSTATPTKQITTLLAHPVIFNCAPPTPYKPCHWHLSPAFGLTGLGPPPSGTNTVTVSLLRNGKGYREVSGGHTGAGMLPCRMCVDCTMDRVLVCACPSHHLERISMTTSTKQQDWSSAFAALERCKPGTAAHKSQLARWCSICPSLAVFRCTTPQSTTDISTTTTTTTTTPPPCGLALCEPCALIFTECCANDLQRMVAEFRAGIASTERAREFWPLGLRADWEFFGVGEGAFLMEWVLGV